MIAEYRILDIRLELINGASVNGSAFLVDGQTILTAAHVLSALVDQRVESISVRTLFGSQPFVSLDPARLKFVRLGDPDPDRDGQADVDAIVSDLALIQSEQLRFDIPELPRDAYDTSLPVTRFVLDGFSPRPSLSVSAGFLTQDVADLWTFDETLVAEPGDSGSPLVATSGTASHIVGVTSTTDHGVALGDPQWAWFDEASEDLTGSLPESDGANLVDAPYFFRTTVGDDLLVRHMGTGVYVGEAGVDRAMFDGPIEQITMTQTTGNFLIEFSNGDVSELIGFEQVLTPSHRYYSSNDPIYAHLYRAITVLEGYGVAADWTGTVRHWFDDELTEIALVDSVLALLGYSSPTQIADTAFVDLVASHINLFERPESEVEAVLAWANGQSFRDVTQEAIAVVDEFLGVGVDYGFS